MNPTMMSGAIAAVLLLMTAPVKADDGMFVYVNLGTEKYNCTSAGCQVIWSAYGGSTAPVSSGDVQLVVQGIGTAACAWAATNSCQASYLDYMRCGETRDAEGHAHQRTPVPETASGDLSFTLECEGEDVELPDVPEVGLPECLTTEQSQRAQEDAVCTVIAAVGDAVGGLGDEPVCVNVATRIPPGLLALEDDPLADGICVDPRTLF